MNIVGRLCAAVAAITLTVGMAVAQEGPWREPDPQNVLVIDTNKGRIIVELTPEAAPGHVERVRSLARRGFYDGHGFFRVIDDFMAQTGDPTNTGTGGSELPDLKAEFQFRRSSQTPFAPLPGEGGAQGFVGVLPVQTQPDMQMAITADGRVPAMPLFCPGVVGMAREGGNNDSGNSQFFLMRQAFPRLNGEYTAFGRVLSGLEVVRSIKTGEPVPAPMDVMTSVRVLADIPEGERPQVRVMNTASSEFAALAAQRRAEMGTNFDICALDIPASVQ